METLISTTLFHNSQVSQQRFSQHHIRRNQSVQSSVVYTCLANHLGSYGPNSLAWPIGGHALATVYAMHVDKSKHE